jgi:hypothetical protein
MTTALPASYPGGKTFAGWNRQLASLQPRVFLAADLRVEEIELLVRVCREQSVDPLSKLLLDTFPDQGFIASDAFAEQAPIDAYVVRSLILELRKAGLIQIDHDHTMALTEAGTQARLAGNFKSNGCVRRSFHFLDLRPAATPFFVKANHWPLQRSSAQKDVASALGPAAVIGALNQSAEWKQQRGFPAEIEAVLDLSAPGPCEARQRIAVIRVRRLSVAVAGVDVEDRREWLLLPAKSDGWSIASPEPLQRLPFEAIPALAEDRWRESWLAWCASKRISPRDSGTCQLKVAGNELQVSFPTALQDSLRKARDELMKTDTWITADAPPFRWAMPLRVANAK